ncbi:unnamed protein product [Didymodactylos carnosus]|nr:unnamed protein product [Didymodactylos carnosus]CAF3889708.1 unnamed protein product [Didymodactylos carnosus]
MDPKLLPYIVIEKNKMSDFTVFKLACQYGVLQNSFSVDHFVELKSSCPQVLNELKIGELNDISFIEACKLFARGSVSSTMCDCKKQVKTLRKLNCGNVHIERYEYTTIKCAKGGIVAES